MKKKLLSIVLAIALLASMATVVAASNTTSDADIEFVLPHGGIFIPQDPPCDDDDCDCDNYIPGFTPYDPGATAMNLDFGRNYISTTTQTIESVNQATVGVRAVSDNYWRLDVQMSGFRAGGDYTMGGTMMRLNPYDYVGVGMDTYTVVDPSIFNLRPTNDGLGNRGPSALLASGLVDGNLGELGVNFEGTVNVPPANVELGTAQAELFWVLTSGSTPPAAPDA